MEKSKRKCGNCSSTDHNIRSCFSPCRICGEVDHRNNECPFNEKSTQPPSLLNLHRSEFKTPDLPSTSTSKSTSKSSRRNTEQFNLQKALNSGQFDIHEDTDSDAMSTNTDEMTTQNVSMNMSLTSNEPNDSQFSAITANSNKSTSKPRCCSNCKEWLKISQHDIK